MANKNSISCFAAPQEGTATEVQDHEALLTAIKAMSVECKPKTKIVTGADIGRIQKRIGEADVRVTYYRITGNKGAAVEAARVRDSAQIELVDAVLSRPVGPSAPKKAQPTSVKQRKQKQRGVHVANSPGKYVTDRVLSDAVQAAKKQLDDELEKERHDKRDRNIKRLRDRIHKLRDRRVQAQGLFNFTVKHELDVKGPDLKQLVSTIAAALTDSIVAITGGSGAVGQALRKLLSYVVPAMVVLWVMHMCAIPLKAVLALLPIELLWPQFTPKMQAIMDDDTVTGAAKMLCLGIVSTLLGKKMPVAMVVAVMSRLEPFRAAAATGIDFLLAAMDYLINSVLKCLPGGMHFDLFERRAARAGKWAAEVMETCKNVPETPEYIEKVTQLYEEGVAMLEILPSLKTQTAWRKISEAYAGIKDQVIAARQHRVEPVALVLHGTPGVGKSVMLPALSAVYMARMHPELFARYDHQPKAFMYTKGREKFWSGYSCLHKIMLLDDLGMARPEMQDSNSEDDFTMIMRCINTAVYPLPQAELSKKGATYFKSDLILATSNLSQRELQDQAKKVLNKPEAINRRLQLFASVRPKPEFEKNGKLDMAAYSKLTPMEKLKCWVFDVQQHVDGDHFEHVGTYDDAMQLMNLVCARASEKRRMANMVDNDARTVGQAVYAECIRPPREYDIPEDEWDGLDFGDGIAREISAQGIFPEGTQGFLPESTLEVLNMFMPILVRTHEIIALRKEMDALNWIGLALASAVVGGFVYALKLLLTPVVKGIVRGVAGLFAKVGEWFRPRREVVPQGSLPEDTAAVLTKSLYEVEVDRGDGFQRYGNMLFVMGQDAIMHYHGLHGILKSLESGANVRLRCTNANSESFTLSAAELRAYSYRRRVAIKGDNGGYEDAVMIRIPKVRMHRDIMHLFESGAATYGTQYQYVAARSNALEAFDATRPFIGTNMQYGGDGDQYMAKEVLRARYPNENFMCGGVMAYRSAYTSQNLRVWGMHVAGDGHDESYCIRITRQWLVHARQQLDECCAALSVKKHVRDLAPGEVAPCLGVLEPTQVTTRRQYHPHSDTEPSMHPTSLHGWSEGVEGAEEFKPANCGFTATQEAMIKWISEPVLPDQDGLPLVSVACSMLEELGMPEFTGRVLTMDEALTGIIDGVKCMERINVASSPGFPLSQEKVDKRRIMNENGTVAYGRDYDILKSQVEAVLGAVQRGEPLPALFKVSPKPEVLPLRKTVPRIIQGAPLEYVVAFRMYFWEVMAYFSQWSPDKECAVGLNPYSNHWAELVRFLNPTRSPNVIAGDYKSFDSTHEPLLAEALKLALLTLYDRGVKSHDYDIRFRLLEPLCGARVLFGDYVYKLPRGLPSGHPMTAVWNSLYNSFVFRLAYYMHVCEVPDGKIVNEACVERARQHEFGRNVRLAVLGDDNLATSVVPTFNEQTLPGLMARLGLTYTMDVKDGEAARPFRSIEEVSFIARGFKPGHDGWLSPLRLVSILDEGQWVQKPKTLMQPGWHADRLQHVLLELSQHSQETWNSIAPKAVEAFVSRTSGTHAAVEMEAFVSTRVPVTATEESRYMWLSAIGALGSKYFAE